MQKIISRRESSRRFVRFFMLLSALAILVGAILLFARSKGRGATPEAAATSTDKKGSSAYKNRAVLPARSSPHEFEDTSASLTGNVYGSDGVPIPGASVVATTFEIAGNIPSKAGSVESDEHGHFKLPLPEGTYQISAVKEGYGPSATSAHTGGPISLVLPRSGVITGHVHDEQDQPVRHFTIDVISSVMGDQPTPPPLWSGKFDSPDGSFRLDQLPSWGVIIKASAADYAPAISPEITAQPGEPSEVTLTMERGCVLLGKVEDGQGAPLPRVVVNAEARVVEGAFVDPAVQTAEHVKTGADGAFRLEHVPLGEVTVRAYDGDNAVAALTLQIADCSVLEPAKLVMSRGGSVTGVARLQDGTPLAGARVSLTGRAIGVVNTTSGSDGRFRFDEIADGAVRLELDYEGRATQVSIGVSAGAVTDQDITLADRGEAELRGRITASGRPLSGIQIQVARSQGPDRGIAVYRPVTDADGNYALSSIAPGSYVIGVLSTAKAGSVHIRADAAAIVDLDLAPTPSDDGT
jgi:Carboxypeptidase regulatory-like domain